MSSYHEHPEACTQNLQLIKDVVAASEDPSRMGMVFGDLRETLKEGLLSLCTATGLAVLQTMMESDVTSLVGPKGRHDSDRSAYRHGSEQTSVALGGEKVAISRPRVRSTDGKGLPIATYEAIRNDDPLVEAALARMLHGLSSRNYGHAQESSGNHCETKGSSKSSVSRRFIKATEAELQRLLRRPLGELDIVALLIDGVQFAKHNVIVSMGINGDGQKHILGVRIAATENARACMDLLTDLVERGLNADEGLLAIIDGSKALKSALKAVFGDQVLIQRCQVHKKRNVTDYLPPDQRPWVDRKLTKAWALDDATKAIQSLNSLATQLEVNHPDAAASLREGLEETVTVLRLNISGLLRKSLSTTNAIESAFDIVRARTKNVKNWKNGKMVQRWAAAGLLEAETRFRRIKGYKDLAIARAEIRRLTVERAVAETDEGANTRKTA